MCARKPQWQGLERYQTTCTKKKFRLEKKINLPSTSSPATTEFYREEEATEFDLSSNKETCEGEGFVEEDSTGSSLGNNQVTRDVEFLIGPITSITSRFGRQCVLTVDSFHEPYP